MLLRDILDKPYELIEARTNPPDGIDGDMLFGHCSYDGENLISLDGDYYSLKEAVEKFEVSNDGKLTYWFRSKWV